MGDENNQPAPWWGNMYQWGQPVRNQNAPWLQTKAVPNQTMSYADTNGATPTWFDASSPAIAKPVGLDFNQANAGFMNSMNGPTTSAYSPSAWDQAFGYRDVNGAHMGYAGAGLAGANLLMNSWLGMQQLALAKDALANSKSQFERNFAAQKNTINSAMETRQDRRNAERNDAMATAEYMSKYGVK